MKKNIDWRARRIKGIRLCVARERGRETHTQIETEREVERKR